MKKLNKASLYLNFDLCALFYLIFFVWLQDELRKIPIPLKNFEVECTFEFVR